MLAVLDEVLSAQPPVSVSVQLIEPAEHDVKVLVREVLRHLATARDDNGKRESSTRRLHETTAGNLHGLVSK